MAEVFLICGKICSGKTCYSEKLKKDRSCVVLSCDEIVLPLEKYLCGDYDGMTDVFKDYFRRKACEIVSAGANVIMEFGLWQKSERESLKKFFAERNIRSELHYVKVSDEVWERHITKRNNEVKLGLVDAYYVDDGLKAKLLSRFEEPSETEIDVLYEVKE